MSDCRRSSVHVHEPGVFSLVELFLEMDFEIQTQIPDLDSNMQQALQRRLGIGEE